MVGILYNLALSPHESYFEGHAIRENAFERMVMIIYFMFYYINNDSCPCMNCFGENN